jgi:hypothetical protein
MTQDEQHLNLLSVFHYVLAGLTALISCVFLLQVPIGIAMLAGAFHGNDGPPRLFAWFFILFPSVFILGHWTLAALMIAAGRRLRRRASWTFCLVVAAMECLLIPFGTVLGVFTIVVLLRDPVRALFAANQPLQATSQ